MYFSTFLFSFSAELSQLCNHLIFGRSGTTTSCAGTPRNTKMSHPSESPRSSSGGQTLSFTTSECEHCGQRAKPSSQIFSIPGVKMLPVMIPLYLVLCGRISCRFCNICPRHALNDMTDVHHKGFALLMILPLSSQFCWGTPGIVFSSHVRCTIKLDLSFQSSSISFHPRALP